MSYLLSSAIITASKNDTCVFIATYFAILFPHLLYVNYWLSYSWKNDMSRASLSPFDVKIGTGQLCSIHNGIIHMYTNQHHSRKLS